MAVLAALAAVGCVRGASPSQPSPVGDSPRPDLTCPAPIVSQSFTGGPIRVSFAPPQAAGGLQPFSVSCAPASGAAFAVGTTTVVCTLLDAVQEEVTCRFTVRILGPPRLSGTRFLAFGDSITLGQTFDTYPAHLLAQLRQRYQTQSIFVFDDGVAGENAFPNGQNRLPASLNTFRPDVLLLMEGTNDLNGGATGIARALDALTTMIRTARSRGVVVFLATIPPQRPGTLRSFTQPLVAGFNDSVRALAQREGVALVDIYAAMIGDLSLIGPDDLHPNAAGHVVMAQTFFNVIQRQLELPPE